MPHLRLGQRPASHPAGTSPISPWFAARQLIASATRRARRAYRPTDAAPPFAPSPSARTSVARNAKHVHVHEKSSPKRARISHVPSYCWGGAIPIRVPPFRNFALVHQTHSVPTRPKHFRDARVVSPRHAGGGRLGNDRSVLYPAYRYRGPYDLYVIATQYSLIN